MTRIKVQQEKEDSFRFAYKEYNIKDEDLFQSLMLCSQLYDWNFDMLQKRNKEYSELLSDPKHNLTERDALQVIVKRHQKIESFLNSASKLLRSML